MRSTRGQATVDYVALIAVLAILFGAGLAVAGVGAPSVINAVAGQMRHALCLVGGGPCPDRRSQPCVVASARDSRRFAVSVVIVRVDSDHYLLREEMSDGSVRLTVSDGGAGGVEVGAGARATATDGGRRKGRSAEARAGIQGTVRWEKVYVAKDRRAADAIERALRERRTPTAKPREVFYEGGSRLLGRADVSKGGAGASLESLSQVMLGGRRDKRTGETTIGLGARHSRWGAVTIALGGPAGSDRGNAGLTLKLDRGGKPIELAFTAAGTLDGGAGLSPSLQRALGGAAKGRTAGGSASASGVGGRRWEISARVDLRDPLVSAAWKRFKRHPTSGDAIGALGTALRDQGSIDARVYRTSSTSDGAAAGVSLGVRVGGEYEHTVENSRLLGASSRPSGGLWETRVDCLLDVA